MNIPYRRIQTKIILTQCTGMLAHVFIQNNFMLVYFLALGMAGKITLALLSASTLIQTVLVVPFALLCERFGKKRVGTPGNILKAVGFAVFVVVPYFREQAALLSSLAIVVYSTGNAMHRAGWFALIDPAIPATERGRFFGRMRVAFISVGAGFTLLAGALLHRQDSLGTYQVFLLLTSLALLAKVAFYLQIPDLAPGTAAGHELSLPRVSRELLGRRAFVLFNAYLFFLTLFSDGAHAVFGLLEKQVLGYSDTMVAYLGNAMLMGMLAGFVYGGHVSDRRGTRFPFLFSQLAYLASMLLFVAASRLLPGQPALLGLIHGLYGFSRGCFSIAFTHEMLALVPLRLKSLSTTLTVAMTNIGGGLSLLLAGLLVDSRVFAGALDGTRLGLRPQEAVLLLMCLGLLLLLPFRRWNDAAERDRPARRKAV